MFVSPINIFQHCHWGHGLNPGVTDCHISNVRSYDLVSTCKTQKKILSPARKSKKTRVEIENAISSQNVQTSAKSTGPLHQLDFTTCNGMVGFLDAQMLEKEIGFQISRDAPCYNGKIDGKRTDQCDFPTNRVTPGFRPCLGSLCNCD